MTHDGMIQNPLYPTDPGYVIKPSALVSLAEKAAAERAGGHVDDFESYHYAATVGLDYRDYDRYRGELLEFWLYVLDDEDGKALWEAFHGPAITAPSEPVDDIPF
ncbi:hypothetical protein [Halomonas sp. 3A7M]|uniref:hypothetical protein n=1 Tax=Halomonas sp. 3A7M TaxID=2742616 RepID=UPI001868B148|nr:hypothetical protein [Halomonas sp. 3A7M]